MTRSLRLLPQAVLTGLLLSISTGFLPRVAVADTVSPAELPSPSPITQVQLVGNTVLKPTDLDPILKPLQGKSLTPEQVKAAAAAITQLYLNQGYVTSSAHFDPQAVSGGVATIQATEGTIDQIEIQGLKQTHPGYVRSRLDLDPTKPFNANRTEEKLRLLRSDPLFRKLTARLQPSATPGKSTLIVDVEEEKSISGTVSFDNYSPIAIGGERVGVGLAYRNLTGWGDTLSASYSRTTTGGANLYDFTYTLPVNPMNGTVSLRYAFNDYRITDPAFAALNITGKNRLYDLTYRQMVIRTPREELAFSVGLTHQSGQTFLFQNLATPFGIGPDPDGVSTTSVVHLGQDYTRRDLKGIWALRSQFNIGTGFAGATFFTTPNAGFFSWTGQVQRVQRLSRDAVLLASLDTQLSADPLLPSQQFVIGGGNSLRGFRQNARSADNGVRLSLETRFTTLRDRQTQRSLLQVAPFIDLGTVWNNPRNPNLLPSQNFLAAAGVGLIVEPVEHLVLRVDGALPFVNLKERGHNLQDAALYFNASYQF